MKGLRPEDVELLRHMQGGAKLVITAYQGIISPTCFLRAYIWPVQDWQSIQLYAGQVERLLPALDLDYDGQSVRSYRLPVELKRLLALSVAIQAAEGV